MYVFAATICGYYHKHSDCLSIPQKCLPNFPIQKDPRIFHAQFRFDLHNFDQNILLLVFCYVHLCADCILLLLGCQEPENNTTHLSFETYL